MKPRNTTNELRMRRKKIVFIPKRKRSIQRKSNGIVVVKGTKKKKKDVRECKRDKSKSERERNES